MSLQPEEVVASENGDPFPEKVEQKAFSWTSPHPLFVIILVGLSEQPFGLQLDFLCHRSGFYRKYFEDQKDESLERVVKLPEASVEVFGMAQNFLYTGKVAMEPSNMPSYESLVGLWNLGHKLDIDGLCDQTLEAMVDCRRISGRIPATPLLIQVWRDTPEGSSIRILLLSWAAEYMRCSESRAEFAKSLPQEVLSELVVTMSSFDSISAATATATAASSHASSTPQVPPLEFPAEGGSSANTATGGPAGGLRKNVHYLEDPTEEEEALGLNLAAKRNRPPGGGAIGANDPAAARRPFRRPGSPPPPPPKASKRRSSAAYLDGRSFTSQQKLDFCADLLTRMLSGPGFWTRLVGPFKEPVDPVEDGVPDYFEKVKRPMDLGSIKAKMDRKEYTSDEDFLVDVRQIFDNCFTYWKKGDPMWAAGERLQKTFEDKFLNMNKWIAKMGGEEGD